MLQSRKFETGESELGFEFRKQRFVWRYADNAFRKQASPTKASSDLTLQAMSLSMHERRDVSDERECVLACVRVLLRKSCSLAKKLAAAHVVVRCS